MTTSRRSITAETEGSYPRDTQILEVQGNIPRDKIKEVFMALVREATVATNNNDFSIVYRITK